MSPSDTSKSVRRRVFRLSIPLGKRKTLGVNRFLKGAIHRVTTTTSYQGWRKMRHDRRNCRRNHSKGAIVNALSASNCTVSVSISRCSVRNCADAIAVLIERIMVWYIKRPSSKPSHAILKHSSRNSNPPRKIRSDTQISSAWEYKRRTSSGAVSVRRLNALRSTASATAQVSYVAFFAGAKTAPTELGIPIFRR
jgi:hypothetical protein